MHTLPRTFAALLFCAGLPAGALAAEIARAPGMGLAKSHTFTATPGTAGAAINWSVDRVTRNETNGGNEAITKNVYTASGTSATFNLSKVSGKQTIWRIRATDSTGSDTQEVQVFPANALSSFTFSNKTTPLMRYYVVVPSSLSDASKLLFVLHGASRNADDYCGYWRNWTTDNDTLLICPYFSESQWPGGRGYNRGNVFANESDTQLNPESKWAYSVIDKVHKYARKGFALDDKKYDIWGHSAGGQFIERFLLFKPDAKFRLAMPANPGWYMMPSLSIDYQCGAKHAQLEFTQQDMIDFSLKNAVLFAGTADTDPNDPETGGCMDVQGRGRYARAGYFYNGVLALNPETTWRKVDFVGIDHDGERMAEATQDWLDEQARKAGR